MPTRLVHLVVDAADPSALARFWSAALEWPVTVDEPDEVVIEPPADDPAQGGQLPLVFVPVADPKTAKNRIHLDLASTSADHQRATVTRLEGLGAQRIDIGQRDVSWVVMADPEGNEFCVARVLRGVSSARPDACPTGSGRSDRSGQLACRSRARRRSATARSARMRARPLRRRRGEPR
jgi:predicted enzyme related to lactoylglutathione lyase